MYPIGPPQSDRIGPKNGPGNRIGPQNGPDPIAPNQIGSDRVNFVTRLPISQYLSGQSESEKSGIESARWPKMCPIGPPQSDRIGSVPKNGPGNRIGPQNGPDPIGGNRIGSDRMNFVTRLPMYVPTSGWEAEL